MHVSLLKHTTNTVSFCYHQPWNIPDERMGDGSSDSSERYSFHSISHTSISSHKTGNKDSARSPTPHLSPVHPRSHPTPPSQPRVRDSTMSTFKEESEILSPQSLVRSNCSSPRVILIEDREYDPVPREISIITTRRDDLGRNGVIQMSQITANPNNDTNRLRENGLTLQLPPRQMKPRHLEIFETGHPIYDQVPIS